MVYCLQGWGNFVFHEPYGVWCNGKEILLYSIPKTDFLKEILRGNLLWRPSCRNVWRWVIVPLDFFVAKSTKRELLFPSTLKSRTHISYGAMNHAVTIVFAGRAKSEGKITHFHTWRSIWRPLHSVNTGVKKRLDSPILIPWFFYIK